MSFRLSEMQIESVPCCHCLIKLMCTFDKLKDLSVQVNQAKYRKLCQGGMLIWSHEGRGRNLVTDKKHVN